MPEAGKTSTLNMLTGAVLPSAGSAFLGGFDVVQEQRKVGEGDPSNSGQQQTAMM